MAPQEVNKFKAILDSKWTWIGGGIGALGIIYYYHKSNAASAATGTSTDTTETTTDTTDSSGYGYDSAYSPIDDSGIAAYGVTPSQYYNDGNASYTGTTQPQAITNNNQWAQAAEINLINAGYDGTAAAAAIGKYLLGSELSSNQTGIVQAAIGLTGQPPKPVALHNAPATKYTVRKPPPGTKFVSDAAKHHTMWELWPDGTNHYVNQADYAFLGRPKYTEINAPKKH